jgi:hypothetical protein
MSIDMQPSIVGRVINAPHQTSKSTGKPDRRPSTLRITRSNWDEAVSAAQLLDLIISE